MRAGRTLPTARHPYVSIAVPTVIAWNPDKAWAWGYGTCFHNCRGGGDPDNDLGTEHARGQQKSEYRTNQ